MSHDQTPVLILTAHGTIHPGGPAAFEALAEKIRSRLPAVEVVTAFVDVIGPRLADVLAEVAGRARAVVVPVFLGAGYHVEIDIPQVVSAYEEDQVRVAKSLGPAPEILDVLADRFRAAAHAVIDGQRQPRPGAADVLPDAVVLAAAGSTNPAAREQTHIAADHLAALLDRPVTVGFITAAGPTVREAVDRARAGARTVGVATYLLAPGTFHDGLRSAGADVVADPIGAHDLLADLVSQRYRDAVTGADAPAVLAASR